MPLDTARKAYKTWLLGFVFVFVLRVPQYNNLEFERIKEDTSSRPDYWVRVGDTSVIFELKELWEDEDFGVVGVVYSRTVGSHVRARIIDKTSGAASELFNGKNQSLQDGKNTSFSAVGRLMDREGRTTVTLFENIFARVPVPYGVLPPCFEVKRVEVSRDPLQFSHP